MKIRLIKLLKVAWLPVAVTWLGAFLNILVVRANGGMPTMDLDRPYDRWVPLNSQTQFPFLGDVILLLGYQTSLGDILMYLGTSIWLYRTIQYIYRVITQTKERRFSWF
jgi:hypothetical protein